MAPATRTCCLLAPCGVVAALLLVPAATARTAATFVSHRYGYSIVLPGASDRWSVEPALYNLSGSSTPGSIHSPLTDVFTEVKTQRLYILASRPNQSNLRRWTRFVISIRPDGCSRPHALPHTTLAGAPALAFTWSCPGRRGIMIAALHAGRGYFMLVSALRDGSSVSNPRAFDAARRSFRFLHT